MKKPYKIVNPYNGEIIRRFLDLSAARIFIRGTHYVIHYGKAARKAFAKAYPKKLEVSINE